MSNDTNAGGGPGQFPETPWTQVALAGAENTLAHQALSKLCDLYWYPVYAFLRRTGRNAHDAEDLTQEFFQRVLAANDFGKVDQEKGRLRSYLLGALKNFLAYDHRRKNALKRGGGTLLLSFDADEAEERYAKEPGEDAAPDQVFDRRWAMTVLDHAMNELEADYRTRDKGDLFEAISPQLTLAGADSGASYEAIGQRLDMSVGSVKVAVHRLRKRYRELIYSHIAPTVANEDEIDHELSYFLSCLH